MATTIDEDLNQIERDIRTLKIEYEQFFGGGRKRPPTDTQWRLDNLVRRCNEKTGELNFGQRFKLNNLTQTYAKYQDFWRKKTMQRETGLTQRHFGAAAKAIEAERESRHAAEVVTAGHHDAAHRSADMDPPVPVPNRREPFVLAFSQPENEQDKLDALYKKLIEARSETGENAGAPSLQDFSKFVRNKTQDLKSKGGNEVEYTVSIEAGKVKLKARVSG